MLHSSSKACSRPEWLFLKQVRDGKVALSKAQSGGFNVTALTPEEEKRLGKGLARMQAIFGVDMATWENWRRLVRPTDCLMAHRPPAVLPGSTLKTARPGVPFVNNMGESMLLIHIPAIVLLLSGFPSYIPD
jgi:hypothetical protein